MIRVHTPPFCFGCRDFVNSSTAKRNAMFTAHTYIHTYTTLLNNELMNKTKKNETINISHHERTGLIILNIMVCFHFVQNNDIFKQKPACCPYLHGHMD